MSKKQFNWLTTLERLSNGRAITSREYERLFDKARRWPTCACGQLCKELDRTVEGCPTDTKLMQLGMRFADEVCRKAWCNALQTFLQIEVRTDILLKEQNKKQCVASMSF